MCVLCNREAWSVHSAIMVLYRDWINHFLEEEISQPLDNVAGVSVYFGAKNLMAYAQLCLIAGEVGR